MSKRYRAKARITTLADPEVVKRIRAGEHVPTEERGEIIEIKAGSTFDIEELPAHARKSVLQFLDGGRLVEVKGRRSSND
jgi:hypothetical protein